MAKKPKKEKNPKQPCLYCGKMFSPVNANQVFCCVKCSRHAKKDKEPAPKCGRPRAISEETLAKLEQAFSIGSNISLACAYAEIGLSTYYDFIHANPEYSEKFNNIRQKPILKALSVVCKTLDDPKNAQWYLERKLKQDFSTRQELTGKDGLEIKISFDKQDENL